MKVSKERAGKNF